MNRFVRVFSTGTRVIATTSLADKIMTFFKVAMALSWVFLFGCAAHTWTRPNVSEQEMRRDLEQCERDRKTVAGESFFLERCMFSKGYSEE